MRIEFLRTLQAAAAAAAIIAAPGAGAASGGATAEWQGWTAGNEITNFPSLQRGAAAFANYCSGCHSLKYVRWSRLGEDLRIPAEQLRQQLVPAGAKPADYVLTSMPAADAEAWFGIAPPDLSLMVRARGADYVYQFLKTFYLDPTNPVTGADNLALPGTAMPHVLADLEGLKQAMFRSGAGEGGATESHFEKFTVVTPGQLGPEEYDAFVRDIVNFLDWASEPSQVARRSIGIWVILFLLVFTGLAWLMYREYWKDVR